MSATDNIDVLEYRITQLEKMLDPLMKLASDLDKKLALLAQRMMIATVAIGTVLNGAGMVYTNKNAQAIVMESDPNKYSSNDAKINQLLLEIEKLKSKK